MGAILVQYIIFLILLLVLGIPLGIYMGKVMSKEKVALDVVCKPLEKGVYTCLGIDQESKMTAREYMLSIGFLSFFSFIFVFALHVFQAALPFNPQHLPGTSWDVAFNNAISYLTNTNWQAYAGEQQLSYFTQMLGLTVQNFVSAAVGIAVLFAVIRGFTQTKEKSLGNFWVDLIRIILYILLPLAGVVAFILVSQGVVQSFSPYVTATLLEPYTNSLGNLLKEQIIPLGPAASQIAIKQLGTNGGGFFGANSAFPLENPTTLSNLVEMLAILLIPTGLCFTFGRNVKDMKQGVALFTAMFIILIIALGVVGFSEHAGTPQLQAQGTVELLSSGNMEGKEARLGIAGSSAWAVFTTAASNGSVNAMHDSFTPLGGMMLMLLMELGEVIFGGVGCGLYGIIGFAVLTVFIAGLMVGRTPEYLGKKIEPFEMKMAAIICLASPVVILVGSGIATLVPSVVASIHNSGAHGLSEILYNFSSVGGNNGSSFAGMATNTVGMNVALGICMLIARFAPMGAALAMADSLSQKKQVASTSGTLSTSNGMFVFLLIFVILLIGALSFFPALALGPVAEYLQMFK